MVLAIAGAATVFAGIREWASVGSAASEVSGVDTSLDEIVAIRGAKVPRGCHLGSEL